MADFTDIPGALINQRMQGLQNRYQGVQDMFSDPNSYARGRLGLSNQDEDEEEKRRRLAAQAAARGESAPVKETRTTDPATGEVKLKLEGNEADLTAANPNTPTITRPGQPAVGAGYTGSALTPQFNFAQPAMAAPAAPVAPQPDPAEMARARAAQEQAMQAQAAQAQATQAQATQAQAQAMPAPAQAQAQAMPAPAPAQAQTVAAPAQPVRPVPLPNAAPPQQGQPIRDDSGQIVGYETNNQMMKNMLSGAPVGANAPAVPVNPNQAPPAPAQQPSAETATMQQTAEPAATTWQDKLLAAQKDTGQLIDFIANKKENSPESIEIAKGLLKKAYRREEEDAGLEKSLKGLASKDPKEQSDAIKKLRSKDEEGSLFKAYIFNRLGLTQLAQEEQSKITGPKFERAMMDGQTYMTEVNRKGGITAAYDSTGRAVDDTVLAKLNSGASKFGSQAYGFTGGSMTIPQGDPDAGEEYRQRTNSQTGDIENIITTGKNRGKPYTGSAGYEKRVGSQAMIGENNLINNLVETHGKNNLNAEKDMLARLGPYGSPKNPFKDSNDFRETYKFKQAIPTKEMITPSQSNVKPMSAPANPNEPAATMQNTGYQSEQDTGGFIKTGGPVSKFTPLNEMSEESTIRQKGSEQAIESAGAGTTVTAKSRAQRVEALPSREDDARRVIRTINDVINHPGFEISTGATAPIGSLLAMVPGSPFGARDWRAKYGELKGQQFLEAYQNLRGTGSISEKEGSKAEQAVAALSDPGISESEFKRNSELLKNDVKRRIDTERKSLGMKPIEWAQVETDMKKDALSERDRAALTWAEKNPKDPRADKIRKELGF
jgi:hypothetical protein